MTSFFKIKIVLLHYSIRTNEFSQHKILHIDSNHPLLWEQLEHRLDWFQNQEADLRLPSKRNRS